MANEVTLTSLVQIFGSGSLRSSFNFEEKKIRKQPSTKPITAQPGSFCQELLCSPGSSFKVAILDE